ncbi:pilus assembly FimT family protein [Pseudoalteromonas sp. SSM20]|uniref:pilus assembly FimT family protein n=1 Tax=Pseudoalteromonas sp. SSM20 TaxID=3139394 RepID=UPI003BAD8E56
MWVSKQIGMTLPEILIVLALMAGSLSIVAPLSVEMVEKRRHKLELFELKSELANLQYKASWLNQDLSIRLDNEKLIISDSNNKPIRVKSFDELRFDKETLLINKAGWVNSCVIKVSKNGQVSPINAFERLCKKNS